MKTDIFAEMEADAVDASIIPKDKELSGIASIAHKQILLEEDVADGTVITIKPFVSASISKQTR